MEHLNESKLVKTKNLEVPRLPEEFDSSKQLYIVGVPIDYGLENPDRREEFQNILKRAKQDKWPIFITSHPNHYKELGLDGWQTILDLEIKPQDLSSLWNKEGKRSANPINEFVTQKAQESTKPIILLRPGSPKIGDLPSSNLSKEFGSEAEILDAKSGPDIVGDLAEPQLAANNPERVHLAGVQVLDLETPEEIKGKMLLIRSLNSFYKDGDETYFDAVLDKLNKFGLSDNFVYIKGPNTEGKKLTLSELIDRSSEYNLENHYTLAIVP